MKKQILIFGLSLGLCASSLCLAAEKTVYVEANLGYAKINEEVVPGGSGLLRNDNTGLSWGLNAGYKFTQYFGAEVGFAQFPTEKFGFTFQGQGQSAKGSQNYLFDIAAKGILPLSDSGVDLFGKAGVGMVHHKLVAKSPDFTFKHAGTHDKVVGLFGIGADFHVTDNIAIVVQANTTTKNGPVPSMRQATAGVAFYY